LSARRPGAALAFDFSDSGLHIVELRIVDPLGRVNNCRPANRRFPEVGVLTRSPDTNVVPGVLKNSKRNFGRSIFHFNYFFSSAES